MSNVKMSIETITPVKAVQIMKKNSLNRNINEKRVNRLVKSIKSGQWKLNYQPIIISKDGNLINGQHRVQAVIVSKMPIEALVIHNAPDDIKPTLDIGAARNLGNHLQMAGYKGSVFAMASAIVICLSFQKGSYNKSGAQTTPEEMLDYLKSNKRILKSADIFTHTDKSEFRNLLPQSISVAMHYLFCEIDRDKAETFFHGLVQGTELGKTSPILRARTELISMRKESKRSELTRAMALHYLCTAFQAFLDNRRIDSLPKFKEEDKIVLPKAGK